MPGDGSFHLLSLSWKGQGSSLGSVFKGNLSPSEEQKTSLPPALRAITLVIQFQRRDFLGECKHPDHTTAPSKAGCRTLKLKGGKPQKVSLLILCMSKFSCLFQGLKLLECFKGYRNEGEMEDVRKRAGTASRAKS